MIGFKRSNLYSLFLKRYNKLSSNKMISLYVKTKPCSDQQITIEAEENKMLGLVLQKNKIPLEFECGFSCDCGTCSVKLINQQEYERVLEQQPIEEEEEYVLNMENKTNQNIRLSCQLKLTQDLQGITIIPQF